MLIYGGVGYLFFDILSLIGWRLFPYDSTNDELLKQMRWTIHVVIEKIVGLILLSITAFFAARANRPTWKIGLFSAVATAIFFQLIAVIVYLVRFGFSSYETYNDFIYTMLWSIGLGYSFGYLAVRKQYLREKRERVKSSA
jgi:magnesium-transporting ATPase (P-type)